HVDVTRITRDGFVEATTAQLELVNIDIQGKLNIKPHSVKIKATTVRVACITGNKVANEQGLAGYRRERLIINRFQRRRSRQCSQQGKTASSKTLQDWCYYFHTQNPISLIPPSISMTAGGLGTPLLVRRSEMRNDRNDLPSSLAGRKPFAPYCTDIRPIFRKISISSSKVA